MTKSPHDRSLGAAAREAATARRPRRVSLEQAMQARVLEIQAITDDKLRSKAEGAFVESPSVENFLYKRCAWFAGPDVDADDVVAEAKIALWQATKTWRPDGGRSFASWARWGIRFRLGKFLNKSRLVRQHKPCDFVALDGSGHSDNEDLGPGDLELHERLAAPDDGAAQQRQLEVLTRALSKLPERQRQLLTREFRLDAAQKADAPPITPVARAALRSAALGRLRSALRAAE